MTPSAIEAQDTAPVIPTSPAELAKCLSDPQWRINSGLYKILIKGDDEDEDGTVAGFKPNRAQRRFIARLHHRNIILKARQLGFCVAPETRVLTADMRWARIDTLGVGDELVAVDEHPPGGRGKARKMRAATVRAAQKVARAAYRITFDDGRSVVCTDQHPWLTRKAGDSAEWRSLSGQGNSVVGRIKVGTQVRWVTKPWEAGDIEDGWMGGMLDGEGSIAKSSHAAGINVSQRPGPVWDRLVRYATERGYNACIESDGAERPSKHGKVPVPKLAFGRMDEMMRLIGQTRPTRFVGNRFWDGRELPGKRNGNGVGWATVTGIEELGEQPMVDLQTSTGTYIAEGFVSHNTTLICILWLDHALFTPNQRCGVIAHNDDAALVIFRDKVGFAYDNLPDAIKAMCPVKVRNEHEILFAHNNSSIRVATSMRSGTIHRLLISEYGKICAQFPKRAVEVQTGSLPAVPSNGVTVIESTAEGQEGDFYKKTQKAMALQEQGKVLGIKDFRFHFYAWWMEPRYRADPSKVVVTKEHEEYLEGVEAQTGQKLDAEQRAWYVATLDGDFSGDDETMWREYPSCIAGDVLVSTPSGLMPIRDVKPDGAVILGHVPKGVRPVFKITTKLGYQVTCTDDHPIKTPSGEFKKLREGLGVGQRIQLAQPAVGHRQQSVRFDPVPFVDGAIHITEEFAEFLGVFMGDGSFYNGTISVACDAQDEDMVAAVGVMFDKFLGGGYNRVTGSKMGCLEVRKSSVGFAAPMLAMGIVEERAAGGLKRKVHVPDFIRRSPKPVIAAFLRGLFEADGFCHRDGCRMKFFSKYEHVVRDTQMLLLTLGIESRIARHDITRDGYVYEGWDLALRASGVRKFADSVGFISRRKQDRANLSLTKKGSGSNIKFDWTDEIASVEPAGESDVYDITTATHEFIAGGIVVHNCPEEAFKVSTEGTYYAKQFQLARRQGRIGAVPYMPGYPVHTFWDIGLNDVMAIWFMQYINLHARFINYYENSGEGMSHYVGEMQKLGYVYGSCYLPHDGAARRLTMEKPETVEDMLRKLDVRNIQIVPRVTHITTGINQMREAFPGCWFDEKNCSVGLKHVQNYRKQWNTHLGCWMDHPMHNQASNAADALRQYAQGFRQTRTSGKNRKAANWKAA